MALQEGVAEVEALLQASEEEVTAEGKSVVEEMVAAAQEAAGMVKGKLALVVVTAAARMGMPALAVQKEETAVAAMVKEATEEAAKAATDQQCTALGSVLGTVPAAAASPTGH